MFFLVYNHIVFTYIYISYVVILYKLYHYNVEDGHFPNVRSDSQDLSPNVVFVAGRGSVYRLDRFGRRGEGVLVPEFCRLEEPKSRLCIQVGTAARQRGVAHGDVPPLSRYDSQILKLP